MGIAFTFLALAALAAPVAWVLWWGAGSVGTARRAPAALRVTSAGPGVSTPFDHPTAVDTHFLALSAPVTVYRAAGGSPVSTCPGPDAGGRCPKTLADGTVPCAGHVLVLRAPVRGSRDWSIPAGYESCVVGSYSAYRQVAP